MRHFRWVLVVVSLVTLFASFTFADTVDFTAVIPPTTPFTPILFGTSPTPMGVTVVDSSQIIIGGLTITGFKWSGTTWTRTGVILTGRNDTEAGQSSPDHGIGVCSEGTTGAGGCLQNAGNSNELSNQASFELLQLTYNDPNSVWTGIGLSSLDKNGGFGTFPDDYGLETGQVFYGNGTPGNVLDPNGSFATRLCTFNTEFAIPSPPVCTLTALNDSDADLVWNANAVGTYLYVWAGNGSTGSTDPDFGNDFLLRSVGASTPPPPTIPEPSSLALLATGLAGASMTIKRKFRG